MTEKKKGNRNSFFDYYHFIFASYRQYQYKAGVDLNFLNVRKRHKFLGRQSRGMLPWESFGILTPRSPLSWVYESFRQGIVQFHSPRMKPCKSADYFIKVNFYFISEWIWTRENKISTWKVFLSLKIYFFSKIWPISVKQWKPVWIRAYKVLIAPVALIVSMRKKKQ